MKNPEPNPEPTFEQWLNAKRPSYVEVPIEEAKKTAHAEMTGWMFLRKDMVTLDASFLTRIPEQFDWSMVARVVKPKKS